VDTMYPRALKMTLKPRHILVSISIDMLDIYIFVSEKKDKILIYV
jgi:hypothetical protein